MTDPLREFFGKVVELSPKHKAIVQFQLDNKTERALLWYDKLKIDGQPLPEGRSIDEFLKINTLLKFSCHTFDDTGIDRCRWYITAAWRQSADDTDMTSTDNILHGLTNCTGVIQQLARRQGVLNFSNNGQDENVMFLASKLFISGKRVSAKASLGTLSGLEEGRTLCFDAVPCDPTDNESNCRWFATVVWRGRKPSMEYDTTRGTVAKKNTSASTSSAPATKLAEMKSITSNPHSVFLRCEGQILTIVNEEYGVALAAIKFNRWESVLFHRSVATLFDKSLANQDLRKCYKKGDRLRIVAAAAPKSFKIRWIASQIHIYVDPSIAHLFQF